MQDEILYRYLVGECTPEEEEHLKAWYEKDPKRHQKELDSVRFLFEGILLHGVIGRNGGVTRQRIRPVRALAVRFMRVAALLAFFSGSMYWVHTATYNRLASQQTVVEAPPGQRIRIELADGTRVWLNAGSRLEHPVVFEKGVRRVKVAGEAMFEVEHDAARPFVVETFASRIEVLGTKFNVVADERAGKFSTTLLCGKVKVVGRRDGQTLYMRPNERVSLVGGRLLLGPDDDPVAMRWTEGLLSLKGATFEELMAKFERVYDVRIVIDRQTLPVVGFESGKIRVSDGVDHALRVLQHVAKFTYTRDEETNVIRIQ